jgi:hypothetical protein
MEGLKLFQTDPSSNQPCHLTWWTLTPAICRIWRRHHPCLVHPPRPVIVPDLTPREIGPVGLTTVTRASDMHLQHPTDALQGAGRPSLRSSNGGLGFICVTVSLPARAAQYHGRNTAPVEHERGMRAGGSETLRQGAKQCPDPRPIQHSPVAAPDGQRGASEGSTFGAEQNGPQLLSTTATSHD